MTPPFYDFESLNIQGQSIKMDSFRGKLVLIVNTASKCGLTPQYEGLESLYTKYKDQGLMILGFPCNQFGKQEPDDESSISTGCLLNYGVSFPMFSKIDVNGSQAHPLYVYLKSQLSGTIGKSIKWNFTKFLIDQEGTPIKRFAPITKPEKMESFIKKQLEALS